MEYQYRRSRQSISAGINMMKATHIPKGGKRWAILGDMLDLGKYARDEHYVTGQALFGNVDYLIAIGDQARFYVEGALDAGMSAENIHFFAADVHDSPGLEAAKHEATNLLIRNVQSIDLLLLKGSNMF